MLNHLLKCPETNTPPRKPTRRTFFLELKKIIKPLVKINIEQYFNETANLPYLI